MAKSSQFAFERLRPLSTNSWMDTIEAAGASRTTARSSVSPTRPTMRVQSSSRSS